MSKKSGRCKCGVAIWNRSTTCRACAPHRLSRGMRSTTMPIALLRSERLAETVYFETTEGRYIAVLLEVA